MNSLFAQGMANLGMFISYIPYIGLLFSVIEMIPFIGESLVWSIGYILIYFIKKYNKQSLSVCNKEASVIQKVLGIISLIITIIAKIVSKVLDDF